MKNIITTMVNEMVKNEIDRVNQLAKTEEAVRKAKATLKEAYRQRRIAKGTLRNINWKQSAQNMAELLNELPCGVKFTPTQLSNIYAIAYPTDKDFGLLHIHSIAQTSSTGEKYGCCEVVGLIQDDRGRYYRKGTAEVRSI